MKLYEDNGYLSIDSIMNLKIPFIFVIGGRGIGKTYGALKYVVENDERFIFMRRTATQTEIINHSELSPFKIYCKNTGLEIKNATIAKNIDGYMLYDETCEKERLIGYSVSLTAIKNVRGFDASDVKVMIYDEFIPEAHEHKLNSEGTALLNAYETVNRNRELNGEPPVTLLCLANSNNVVNPILMEFGLVTKAEEMQRTGQKVHINRDRGLALFILPDSPISFKKKETALYKFAEGSEFSKMSLENDFSDAGTINVRHRPIKEYNPIVTVGELTIYKHKSNGMYYVSTMHSGSVTKYGVTPTELTMFHRKYPWMWSGFLSGKVECESFLCEKLFIKYLE